MRLELANLHLPLGAFPLRLTTVIGSGITGISGASGSGKTSLLETIAGLRQLSSGKIILNATVLEDRAAGVRVPPWQRRMGYVPQDQALFPHWDVRRNLESSARLSGAEPDPAYLEKILELLELKPLLTRSTGLLSGGEKARVALGRALMSRPALLLLDEPLAHLDDRLRDRALDYLRAASTEMDLPMLLVSHSSRELSALCGNVLRLEQGQLVEG